MSNKTKYWAIGLAASAAFFWNLESKEGNVSVPYKDTGGVVTQGIGSTTKPDGTKIKMSDPPISRKPHWNGQKHMWPKMNSISQVSPGREVISSRV